MKSGLDHDGRTEGADAAAPRADAASYSKIYRIAGLSLLEATSFGIMVPFMPFVTTEYFARHYTHGVPIDCGRDSRNPACIAGSKDANWWSSWIGAIGSICFFMISPSIGIASDIYGRKPFIVASQIMRLGMPLTMIYFVEYGGLIWPYFLLRLICSIFETMGVSSAAVADSIGADNRATSFGFLFALGYIGFSVSAGVSGFFSRSQALRIAASLCIVRTLYALFILPETLPPEKRTKKTKHTRQRCKNPITGMSILLRSQLFMRLTTMIAITTFVSAGNGQIRMYYLNTVIGFNEKDTSRLMLTFGVGSIVAQLVLLRPIMACGKEKGVIVVSIVARMLECGAYIVSTFIPQKWVIYTTIVPSSLGDLSFAAISSLKSINCSDEEQGRLQGAIYSVRAVFEAVGPVAFAFIYNMMKRDEVWTQILPFGISVVLYGCGAVVAMSLPVSEDNGPSRPPMPFSPVSSTASTPTMSTSASGAFVYDYTDDGDDEEEEDDEDGYLAEPLLGAYVRRGVSEA